MLTRVTPSPKLEDRISTARALLILDHPFFGTAVSKRRIIYTLDIPTAAMSVSGQMYINPQWAEPLSVAQLVFLQAHEACHYMFLHGLRCGARDPECWNWAADAVINDLLVASKVGEPIPGGVYVPGARHKMVEDLYNPAKKTEISAEGGLGGIGIDIGGPVDEDGKPLSDAEMSTVAAEAKVELIQAAKVAKQMGKLPGGITEHIEKVRAVKTPWYAILEPHMTGRMRDGYTFRRPNRRFTAQKLILPGEDYLPKMGPVAVLIDTSASVTSNVLTHFSGHLSRILETCRPEIVHVLHVDARVAHVEEYTQDDLPLNMKYRGRGGTSFKPGFEYLDRHGIEPEVVVYLTDGFGDQNTFSSRHPTIWVTTENTEFPWGTVIKYNTEHEE